MRLIRMNGTNEFDSGMLGDMFDKYVCSTIYYQYSDIHAESYGKEYVDNQWLNRLFI